MTHTSDPDLLRARAHELDRDDPLAAWRDEFVFAEPAVIYLDGNSLGRAPKRTLDRLAGVVTGEWATDLIRSWDHWVDLPARVGDRLAPMIGADEGEVLVHDCTTTNLYQVLHGALALRPERRVIAVDPSDFPSDRYVVDGAAAQTGRTVRHGFDDLTDVAVVVRSMVDYRTAAVVDLAAETTRIHDAGALVVWDLSHAAGVLPVRLSEAGASLAVGCTYKFLNGGPGAPAFTYVARHLQREISQPIWGWWSQRDMFAMGPTYDPRPDIGRFHIGTPSILALAAAEVGISTSADAGIEAIATKARLLTGYAIELCDAWGLTTCTPREAGRRGGHVSVVHPAARTLTRSMIERGVVPDFREPDIVRLGMSPLTTSFADVHDGLRVLADLVRGD